MTGSSANSSHCPIKVAFFDLDGTIVNRAGIITPATLAAVDRLRNHGVHVAAATGRAYFGAQTLLRTLKITEPSLFFSGSLIINPKDEQVLFEAPLEYAELDLLIAAAQQLDLYLELYTRDNYYVEKDQPAIRQMHSFYLGRPAQFHNLRELARRETVLKAVTITNSAERVALQYELQAGIPQLSYSMSKGATHPEIVFDNITNRAAAREHGLEILLQYFQAGREEMAAFGDAEADIPFIAAARYGVAMGNAAESVKKAAKLTTASVEADGAAKAIELILNGF